MPKHPKRPHRRARQTQSSPSLPVIRNRAGRSGLDPLDSYQEEGWALGNGLRALVRGRLRTRNPLLISLMLLFGIGMVILLTMVLVIPVTWNDAGNFRLGVLIYLVPGAALGFLLLVNGIGSILDIVRARQEPPEREE